MLIFNRNAIFTAHFIFSITPKTMNRTSLLTICILLFSTCLHAQVEDFEGETLGGTTFQTGNTTFVLTGDFIISEFDDFSCDGSAGTNRYMDSGYRIGGGSSGVIGSFAPADTSLRFKVSTTVAQCVWPGSDDGELLSSGTFRFTGTKSDNSTVSEDFMLTSTNFTDLVPLTFSDAIWGGVELRSIQIEIAGTQDSTDYFAMDNFVFESTNTANERFNIDDQVSVFPNPTHGQIEFSGIEYGTVRITDQLGKVVLTTELSQSSINVSSLPGGVYMMHIRAGDRWATKKLVKR